MTYLYESLKSASKPERREITTWMVHELRDGPELNEAFYALCCDVIMRVTGALDDPKDVVTDGVFSAIASAGMVRREHRVRGYLQAIERAKGVETVIDGGCGSSALLSLAAVALKPEVSKVVAYEINEESAQVAEAMVELCGMEEHIEIRNEDILQATIPTADLGMTETFDAALLFEPGPRITAALARSCRIVLPAEARIWAMDDDAKMQVVLFGSGREYQFAGAIDLTQANDEFQGSFAALGVGERYPVIIAGFYDAQGEAVIRPGGGADMTRATPLGPTVWVNEPGTQINFRYKLGSNPADDLPQVWVNSPSD